MTQIDDVVVSQEINEYLDQIEITSNCKIDIEQRRWYFLKHQLLGESMKQEYPSTPAEAFEASNEGLYYGAQIAKLRADGHITRVPYQESIPVHLSFDIGYDDHTSIWFFQLVPGGTVNVIDYYENCNEGAKFYNDILRQRGYTYGTAILPPDAQSHNPAMGNTWLDVFTELFTGSIHVVDKKDTDILNGIQGVRSTLGRCYFDEARCSKGIQRLESYKKSFNDKLGCYRNVPLHDENSHCCLVGSTLISTSTGDVPISEIQIGDLVKTPTGYKRVLDRFKYKTNRIIKIETNNGFILESTGNHKIFTNKNLVYADTLRYNDVLISQTAFGKRICQKYTGSHGGPTGLGFRETFLLMNHTQKFSLMGNLMHGMGSILKGLKDYIELFGNTIKEKYRRAATFIMLMVTPKIMTSPTCNACMPGSIYVYQHLPINGLEAKPTKNNLEKIMRRQKNGTLLKKAKDGTQTMEKTHGEIESGLKSLVAFVEKLAPPPTLKEKLYAPCLVRLSKGLKAAWMMSKENVLSVLRYLPLINTEKKERVQNLARENYVDPIDVYDITVEEDHCYYANGILVSNSDSFRYLAVGLEHVGGKRLTPEQVRKMRQSHGYK